MPSPRRPLHSSIVPSMASTVLSFSTSIDPEQTKKMAWSASPCRRRYSPGAQKEVLMCSDRERRQPRLAEENSESSRISLLRCMVMSERSSSGKSFRSYKEEEGVEVEREGECWGSGGGQWDMLWKCCMLQLIDYMTKMWPELLASLWQKTTTGLNQKMCDKIHTVTAKPTLTKKRKTDIKTKPSHTDFNYWGEGGVCCHTVDGETYSKH